MDTKTALIAAGVLGVTVLLLMFSKRHPTAGVAADMTMMADCTDPCEVQQDELSCVQCSLGHEGSACYEECNIMMDDDSCFDCLGNLEYDPAWLDNDVWARYQNRNLIPEYDLMAEETEDPVYGVMQDAFY